MTDYAALILPSANRVYADSSAQLMQAEIAALDEARLGGRLERVETATIGGRPYVTFSGPPAAELDLRAVSRLSALYALFERRDDLLAPVEIDAGEQFDEDLVTIQRYAGKTNELFTKLLTNVTLAVSPVKDGNPRPPKVLDPLCGRGSTLNRALMYGCDALGVELDRKDFDAYAQFLTTYLKRKRIKHRVETNPGSGGSKKLRRLQVTLAADKERYRAGDTLTVNVVNGDTTGAADYFRSGSVDAIVADAPYGIQHGSHGREGGLTRSPLALVEAALPAWIELLRGGGALGMSWNTLAASRERVVEVLTAHGMEVLDRPPFTGFEHRVDQAIVRDLVIARKPA